MRQVQARFIAACFASLAGSMFCGAVASAQRSGASLEAGALNMQYADSVKANAVAITPSFWTETDLTSLSGTGTLSEFIDGGWSAQGSADASIFTRRIGFLLGELEGTGGGSTHNDGSRTGQLLGSGRVHIAATDRGMWIGAGVGSTWDGAEWRSVRQGEAAGWVKFGPATAFVSATPVAVNDSIRYTDAQLSASFNLPRVELDASGGFRSGSSLPSIGGNAKSWGSISVTGWIASRLALVASAGTYPVDLTQGFPGGRFASLGLRLGSRRFPPATASVNQIDDLRSAARSTERNSSGISAFNTRVAGSGTREIRVRAPAAQSIEIMADFTEWRAVPLQSSGGGWWTVTLPVGPGIHEMNLRIDGGRWTVPPGLPAQSDEFGGSVGVLVIN
jgi:hypothetical protein